MDISVFSSAFRRNCTNGGPNQEGQNLNFAISAEIITSVIHSGLAQTSPAPKPGFPSPTPDEKLARFYYLNALAEYAHQNYERAIKDFTEAIRTKPAFAEAYRKRGESYNKLDVSQWQSGKPVADPSGDSDKALADFSEAIRLNPDDAEAYYDRADSTFGQYLSRIADYSEAIRLNPHYANAYGGRGDAHFGQGEYAKAVADFTEFLRLAGPNHWYAHRMRGLAYLELRQYDKASVDLTEAMRQSRLSEGIIYSAVHDYTEFIRIHPDDAHGYCGRAMAYFELKQYDKALEDYSEAIRADSNYVGVYESRGKAYEAIGEHEKAKADFETAKQLRFRQN